MKRLVLCVLLMLGVAVSALHAQWTQIPSLPVVINWPMSVEYNGTVYLFGGDNGTTVSNSVYSYTPGDAAWKQLTVTLPGMKIGGYAALVNGKIYLVGGDSIIATSNGYSYTANNGTYVFDPVAKTFTMGKPIPNPSAFFECAAVGGKIYVVDGSSFPFSGNDLNLLQVYDPSADKWTNGGTTPPFGTRLAASAVLNGNIYVMGGLSTNATVISSDVWKGVPSATDIAWTKVGSLPTALMQVSGGAAAGELVFTGGANPNIALPGDYSNTYVSTDSGATWKSSYALPDATFNGGQLFGTGNDLYFAGGYTDARAFKFTVSSVKQPGASLSPNDVFVNLSQNNTQDFATTVENLGVVPLTVTISIPDSVKSWLTATPPGDISSLGSGSYTLHVSSGTMAAGLYKAVVTINTNDAAHTGISQKVSLYVLPSTITLQPTMVLLENSTGDWCGYCPDGNTVIQGIKDNNDPTTFACIEYHMGPGVPSTDPLAITVGEQLTLDMQPAGTIGAPLGAIQRWLFPGQTSLATGRGYWAYYVQNVFDQQPNAPASINVISYTFNQTTRKVHAVIQVQRTQAMLNVAGSTINLTTVVTQDGLTGQQEDYNPSPHVDNPYTWNDVARLVYPGEFGAKMNFPTPTMIDGGNIIVPGDQAQMTVDLTVPTTIAAAAMQNCNITFIASVVVGTSTFGPVLQVMRMPLVSTVTDAVTPSGATTFSLDQNYPNPVSSETTIGYSVSERTPVSITVHDILGREVARLVNATMDAGTYNINFDASKLSAGTYIYTLNAGGKTIEKTMSVIK